MADIPTEVKPKEGCGVGLNQQRVEKFINGQINKNKNMYKNKELIYFE